MWLFENGAADQYGKAARCAPCVCHLRPPGTQFAAPPFARALPMSLFLLKSHQKAICCCLWVLFIASRGAGGRKTGADRWSGLVNALSCSFHLLFLFAQFCSLQLRKRPLYCLSPESELRSFSSQVKNKKDPNVCALLSKVWAIEVSTFFNFNVMKF